MRCEYRMFCAAMAVFRTSSTGSLYVVMKTSTVAPKGAGGGALRWRARHMVKPNRVRSMTLYVSASTSGTEIHQALQFTDASHRHAT